MSSGVLSTATMSNLHARRKLKSTPSSLGKTGRKALWSLETNVASYDRTDPFAALNVLRRLLASLSTRLGGCQYKMTMEEHKLSMHLLTIIEPFVGHSQSRRTLVRQPTELLDDIIFQLDSRRDLLNLALTCKRMHDIIFPRHFEYRVVRAKVSSISLWNHLIVNRSLARNIRVLEIVDERSAEVLLTPSDITTTDTDLESSDDELRMHAKQERFLISALTKMTHLQKFVWSCNHSPMGMESVWPTLLRCQSLHEINISDNLVFVDRDTVDQEKSNKKATVLREVRTISLQATKHAFGATKNPSLTRAFSMLNNCPNLEDLTVSYSQRRGADFFNPTADDMFLCGRWPKLRSLSLSNLWCTPHTGMDIATTFLAAHTHLEVLHLDVSLGVGHGAVQLVLPPDALPNLRELRGSREVVSAVLQCPCSVQGGRPLETIKGVKLSGSGWDDKFFAVLRMFGTNVVKRIELAGWNEMDDIRKLIDCVPRLTWLDIGKRTNSTSVLELCGSYTSSSGTTTRNGSSVHPSVIEWATLLSPLAELTTFHGVRFFYEVNSTDPTGPITTSERSRLRKNEEIASVLAWKCPKLRRLDYWEEGSMKVIVLIRDGDKIRYEVRRIKA